MAWPAAACTSLCHSSRFSMAPPLRFQPRASQSFTHSDIPFTRYSESDTYTISACRHCRRTHSRATIAPASAIFWFVVLGEHSKKSQRAMLSPAGASIRAALPPGLGGSIPLPMQLSSACTKTRAAISGLDHDRNVGVPQDLLRVRHHDPAGASVLVRDVRAGEERIAPHVLDDARHHRARRARLDVRDERHALHGEHGLGFSYHLEAQLVVDRGVDHVHGAPDDAR